MLRPLFTVLSPGGRRSRLSIVIFHRVHAKADALFPDEPDTSRFDQLCGWLRAWFYVMPLREAAQRLQRSDLPPRAMAITFDDGYADNLTQAAPVMKRHGLPCTFFVASGFTDGGCMWNDVVIESIRRTQLKVLDLRGLQLPWSALPLHDGPSRRSAIDQLIGHAKYMPFERRAELVAHLASRAQVVVPTDLMLTSEQIRQLRQQGFDIGGHTVNHPILARLDCGVAREEIERGRADLERVIGERVSLFAYPNGKPGVDYTEQAVRLVRNAGFDAAVSTGWGVSTPATDRFQLARFTPWDRSRTRFALRLARNLMSSGPMQAAGGHAAAA